jgi:hypothetical protein
VILTRTYRGTHKQFSNFNNTDQTSSNQSDRDFNPNDWCFFLFDSNCGKDPDPIPTPAPDTTKRVDLQTIVANYMVKPTWTLNNIMPRAQEIYRDTDADPGAVE